jgi:hypothetical protein
MRSLALVESRESWENFTYLGVGVGGTLCRFGIVSLYGEGWGITEMGYDGQRIMGFAFADCL